ncbi:MAG: esterase-like activity of phytase family protein, partial [Cyanobacteria bacterium J06633_2]
SFPIAERYLPQTIDGVASGVQDNRGFEALTLSAAGSGVGRIEPYRVFAAVEEPLLQDVPVGAADPTEATDSETGLAESPEPEAPAPGRILHYIVSDTQSTLIAEHLYMIEPKPFGAFTNGLVEMLSIDQAGHFLSLERSFGINGSGAKLFQVAIANATDTSQMSQVGSNVETIQPVQKRLELDLLDLDIYLDNLEGMTLGPRLPDGSQSLILVSDDNFNDEQITQWLLFRVNGDFL